VGIGPADIQAQLRSALAMGADRALLVQGRRHRGAVDCRARVLEAGGKASSPCSLILGKQAIDDDNGQTGQMLAALWIVRRPPSRPSSNSTAAVRARRGRSMWELETIEVICPR